MWHYSMVPSSSSSRRPQRLIGDPVVLHAQSEAVRRRHHGAGPRLHSHHGNPSQTTHLRPQWILYLQVHPDCVYTKQIIYIIYGCCMNNSASIPASFGLKRKNPDLFKVDFSVFLLMSRLCLQEGSIYLHPSCTPTWRAVGWGQFWWGEAKSWRWSRRTSISVHTIRWASSPWGEPAFVQSSSSKKKQTKSCMNFLFCTF